MYPAHESNTSGVIDGVRTDRYPADEPGGPRVPVGIQRTHPEKGKIFVEIHRQIFSKPPHVPCTHPLPMYFGGRLAVVGVEESSFGVSLSKEYIR
jgi:hypothetical protein